MRALQRLLSRFSAANLLSLHPPLDHGQNEDCGTCFGEPFYLKDASGANFDPAPGRGMVTAADHKVRGDASSPAVMFLTISMLRYLLFHSSFISVSYLLFHSSFISVSYLHGTHSSRSMATWDMYLPLARCCCRVTCLDICCCCRRCLLRWQSEAGLAACVREAMWKCP